MPDDLFLPTFPPKRGFTPEEQRKIDAFIKSGKMTICPRVGSKELAEMEIRKYMKWLDEASPSWKARAGYIKVKEYQRIRDAALEP